MPQAQEGHLPFVRTSPRLRPAASQLADAAQQQAPMFAALVLKNTRPNLPKSVGSRRFLAGVSATFGSLSEQIGLRLKPFDGRTGGELRVERVSGQSGRSAPSDSSLGQPRTGGGDGRSQFLALAGRGGHRPAFLRTRRFSAAMRDIGQGLRQFRKEMDGPPPPDAPSLPKPSDEAVDVHEVHHAAPERQRQEC